MVKFVCSNCGYKFETEKEDIESCPYCDKKDSVSKEKPVGELLEQA